MRLERIHFEETTGVSDGAGGMLDGEPVTVFSCMAEWEPVKETRTLEATQTTLRQGYRFKIWIDKRFEPSVGLTVRFRDERLTIQGYRYTDTEARRYSITALEQVSRGE